MAGGGGVGGGRVEAEGGVEEWRGEGVEPADVDIDRRAHGRGVGEQGRVEERLARSGVLDLSAPTAALVGGGGAGALLAAALLLRTRRSPPVGRVRLRSRLGTRRD